MKWTTRMMLGISVVIAVWTALGCDRPPPPPTTPEGDWVRFVKPTELAEVDVAQAMLDAKELYRYRLGLLGQYYTRTGNYTKSQWVRGELKNLERAQTFKYVGMTPVTPEPGPSLDEVDEITLAEMVADARSEWLTRVDEVVAYYKAADRKFNAELANSIRYRHDGVKSYAYFLDIEVPPADMKGVDVVPEAEALYAEAHRQYRNAVLLAPLYNFQGLRRALTQFQQLVQQYPSSTKIALAAFYIGQIYEDLNENYRAVQWYERAWQWDPYLPRPARFQAAVVADKRLHNRGKALDWYRAAVENESFSTTNTETAQRRIYELTTEPEVQ